MQKIQEVDSPPQTDNISYSNIEEQIQIMRKVVFAIGGRLRRQVNDNCLYLISRFVFHNPLKLKITLYSLCDKPIMEVKVQYLLVKWSKEQNYQQQDLIQEKNKGQSMISVTEVSTSQKSAYLTLVQRWKAIEIRQDSKISQIIQKGEFFLNFMSGITLLPFNYKQLKYDYNKDTDFHHYQKQQKQRNRSYRLTSDQPEQLETYFKEVMKYKKDKVINQFVLKAFVGLMRKNMVVVKIQSNYSSGQLGCEDNYLYVENQRQVPLANRKEQTGSSSNRGPSLQSVGKQWAMVKGTQENDFKLYRPVSYPLRRRQNVLISRSLKQYLQEDVWIQEIK